MKILFFIASINAKGGVERATVNLVNALSEHIGLEVSLLLLEEVRETDSFKLSPRVKVYSLNIKNYKKHYISLIRGFTKELKKNIDVLITIETMSLIFSFIPHFLTRKKVKHVVWEHFNFKNDNDRKLRKKLRILAAKKADLLVLLTKRDREEWLKNLRLKANSTYIYNISPFTENAVNYNFESKTILSVGRFTKVKGFDRLVRIWHIFQKKYKCSDWNLKIVGYGEEKVNLITLIERLDVKNIVLSSSENVEDEYKQASFYCMTSYSEGLPMVLIEAQSLGLPTIAFDIFTGPAEIINDSTGLVINDNELEVFADSIYQFVSNIELRKVMSANAFEASKRFTKEVVVKKWLSELEKLRAK